MGDSFKDYDEFDLDDYPYYEATYLDDDNKKHFVKIRNNTDLNFYKERYEHFEYNVVNTL